MSLCCCPVTSASTFIIPKEAFWAALHFCLGIVTCTNFALPLPSPLTEQHKPIAPMVAAHHSFALHVYCICKTWNQLGELLKQRHHVHAAYLSHFKVCLFYWSCCLFFCCDPSNPKPFAVILQVRFATMEEIIDHYTFNKRPDEHADLHGQISAALQHLISGGAVILIDNMYYPSFQQPGNYKMDLSGDVNMLRHPVVHALQQHPGIAHAEIDEHFIRDKHPAWYETWAFPRK